MQDSYKARCLPLLQNLVRLVLPTLSAKIETQIGTMMACMQKMKGVHARAGVGGSTPDILWQIPDTRRQTSARAGLQRTTYHVACWKRPAATGLRPWLLVYCLPLEQEQEQLERLELQQSHRLPLQSRRKRVTAEQRISLRRFAQSQRTCHPGGECGSSASACHTVYPATTAARPLHDV